MKKFVCLSLVISLVFACSGSAFAAPELVTGSAFAFNPKSQAGLMALSAVAGQQVFISESGTRYRFTGSSISSGSLLNNSFGSFFSEIMASIAYSAKGLTDKTVSYFHSPTTSDGGDTVNFSVSNSSWLNGVTNAIGEFYREFYKFQYKVLNNGLPSQMTENPSINWTQDYLWKKWLTATSGQVPTISQGGVFRQQSVNWSSMSVLGAIEALFYYPVTGITNGVSLLVRDVRDNDAALDDYLYDKDLTASLIPRTTIWQNMRDFWSNTSFHLSRLAFVLANDEDIEAREASASVRQAYTNDFLKPSGSASPSASDFGTLASGSSSVSDSFHSSYGASDALGSLSDQSDGRWDWFSQTTMDNLNSSGNRSSSMLKSNRGYTNFYDERYRAIKHD